MQKCVSESLSVLILLWKIISRNIVDQKNEEPCPCEKCPKNPNIEYQVHEPWRGRETFRKQLKEQSRRFLISSDIIIKNMRELLIIRFGTNARYFRVLGLYLGSNYRFPPARTEAGQHLWGGGLWFKAVIHPFIGVMRYAKFLCLSRI